MENFKRITAADITPDGHMVILSGPNAAGKTSVLDGIWAALGGGTATRAIERPIRDGATEAVVQLNLGDLVVTRKWKGEKSTLTVTGADGRKHTSPQALLDSLVGQLAFDPLAFATYPPAKQRAILLDLVGLAGTLAELDDERRTAYDDRTDVNRAVKQYDAELAAYPDLTDAPDQELSVADLLEQYEAAKALNARITAARQTVESAELNVAQLRELLAEAEQTLADARRHAEGAPALRDLSAYTAKIQNADALNAAARQKARHAETLNARTAMAARADELTATIEDVDARKAAALKTAVFPVDDLGFDADGVTYHDVPFSQASSAERLRVSTAMGMALNPQLRVMHLRDASLLDSGNLAALADMAAAQDFQLWVERVDESGAVGIVIEDGTVRA
jgi:recombinational DNA repair ATPase RecF